MRELDGSDAGGQFLRTALTLSVLENEPVRLEHVRGDRPNPGLANQHLAVLETLAAVTDAEVSGGELDAETVEFEPGRSSTGGLEGGSYAVDIGTAGSVTLLFDALLPLATVLEAPLSVTATGGTDVEWSPPLDYLRQVKLPLLGAHGLVASCEVDRRGFYPNGGGRATLRIAPSSLEPLALERRSELEGVRLYSTESASLADQDVAHRQLEGALERLDLAGADRNVDDGSNEDDQLEVLERQERTAESPSPGSALVIRVDHGTGIAGFDALGERGKPAERVGEDAADAANRFLEGDAPVDRHMGDQLLVFLALAGGRVRIPRVSDHVETSRALLEAFGREIDLERREEGAVVSRSPDPP
ncbi:RNA 3'-terminal-phosphate cyclase [Natronococcus amylolyticus DSM 10524]|uniref:RNA 3'-terminal phosphate cyclase n=1 Tax=Natronococcus amylolyticus DSM 10524 TaxID=1227497 RepID=L9XIJ3_9EURY|nr:RNA 3'-terminal phosphate cyclase [Natronococcus amylolyticus]ELY61554.1 RNA 3'-terminal-phosphate cyclase [Natronococcus amylolyticus DSM 10524]